jgi:hypothetical protein
MNIKSNNGKLIEEIITNYVNKNRFEPNIENKNEFIIGNVQFENENGIISVIDFAITYNDKTIKSYE